MLMDDVTLECRGRDGIAVVEFEMLDEEACTVEGFLAADTSELLVDLVVLQRVSMDL
jgi:hypothetical protein